MLLKFIRFFRGYVDFYASGKFPERFMNITAKYGINLWNAVPVDNGISASMYVCDYRKIRFAAQKARVKTSVVRRHGMPFIINRYKSRVGLAAGAVVGIILLLILSNFIWSIRILGANHISDTYLYSVLAENGVSVGAYKNNIDVESIERTISIKVKQIGWMSINITGNIIDVEIKEKTDKPHIDSSTKPCNIKAKCDGVITKVKASSGSIKVLKGSGVTKGDLLVSGITETKLDTIQYVRANAEVFADVFDKRKYSVPKKSEYYSLKEDKTDRKRLKFLWLELPCSLSFENYEDSVGCTESQNLFVNDVVLPVGINTLTTQKIAKEKCNISKSEVEKIICNDYMLYEVFNKQNSTTIKRDVVIKESDDSFDCTVDYVFNENIAESVDFDVTE